MTTTPDPSRVATATPSSSGAPAATPQPTGGGTRSTKKRAPYTGIVSKGAAYGLAALSGLLYFLAFAGMDIWPFAFVAFAPLVVALKDQAPRDALKLGLVAGAVMNLTGFSWLLGMLQTFSGFPWPLCALFMLILCTYQGGRFGLLGWLHARAVARGHAANVFFVFAFVASELVYPLLFPWYFAATMHNVPWMTQSADLGGPILIGVVLVLWNLALAEVALARLLRRRIDVRVCAVGIAAVVINVLYSTIRIHQIDARVATADAAKVALVQGNMGLMAKRTDPEEGLRRHLRLSDAMRRQGADLMVWSESSVAFAAPEDGYGDIMRRRFAARIGVPTIFGAILYRDNPDPALARFFNVALATDADGKVTSRYDKQFLLAFGEYLPFGDRFPVLYKWSPHSGKFSPGSSQAPLTLTLGGKARKLTTLICYEDILPGFTRDAVAEAQPDLIVNLTNDAWFGDTGEPWEHLALAKFRAIEHHRYLVRSTNSGVSAIVDPVGRTVTQTATFMEDAKLAEIRFLHTGTVFELLGQWPHALIALAAFAAAFIRRRPTATAVTTQAGQTP